MDSPVTLTVDTPEKIANWRPLVQWFLAIPQFVVAGALGYASSVLAFISFFAVLFTKRVPDGIYRGQVMILRYGIRVSTYGAFMHDSYPPYEFAAVNQDPGGYPAALSFAEPPAEMSRFLPFIKFLMVIPHFVVLFVLYLGASIAYFLAFLSVLFTGKFPAGIQRYLVGVMRWGLRVSAYTYFMTDAYPPFSLE